MAHLGGLIASALLKVVGDQIGSLLDGQIKLQRNFDKDLRRMKETLECVEAVLADAEKRAITEKAVRLWLKKLKDAMYAISDMLDDFEETREVQLQALCFSVLAAIACCQTCFNQNSVQWHLIFYCSVCSSNCHSMREKFMYKISYRSVISCTLLAK